jgi:hypothetical protein
VGIPSPSNTVNDVGARKKMAKRTADPIWVFENYGEREPPCKQTARSRAPPKLSPPLYKASVKELAETGTIRVTSATADIDHAIALRIKKCLERVNHANAPEAEAKAALHLASRLMGRYNVSQAEVLAHESPSTQMQYAGQSVVLIQRVLHATTPDPPNSRRYVLV